MKHHYCRNSENAMVLNTFHRFMDLSLEIRNMIYEYSLVRGTIFIPPVVEDIFAGPEDYLIYGNDDERSSRSHEGHI